MVSSIGITLFVVLSVILFVCACLTQGRTETQNLGRDQTLPAFTAVGALLPTTLFHILVHTCSLALGKVFQLVNMTFIPFPFQDLQVLFGMLG